MLAIAKVIARHDPDIIALTNFDYDFDELALQAFIALLEIEGSDFPFSFAPRPNSGRQIGLDVDKDGRLQEPEDAIGYGRFWGDGGIALLSKFPIEHEYVTSFSDVKWGDMPSNYADRFDDPLAQLPTSTNGHYIVPITTPVGVVSILMSAATAPVFDGPDDLNGLRNADELAIWSLVLDGEIGLRPDRFVIAFNSNLDPKDGEGLTEDMLQFLSRADLQDPKPNSQGAANLADPDHDGPPELDTVDWPDKQPGNLRTSYILPDQQWQITGSGVFWPTSDEADAPLLGLDGLSAGAHRLVWVDLGL